MPADPGDRLGQLGDRVVGVQHRAVAGRAARGQPHPGHALLGDLDQVEALAADRRAEAADLADRLGDAFEEVGMVVDQPARAVVAARLLVGQERQHDVPRRPAALPEPLPDHGEDHRVHVLHVHRAAAPDAAVTDLAGERVDLPVRRVGGDHVEVAVDQQGRPGRVRPGDPGHHAGAARVRLKYRRLQADLGEQRGDVLGRLAFARSRVVAGVRGVDPDQVAGQGGDLVVGADAAGGWVLGHPAIVAPAARLLAARSGWADSARTGVFCRLPLRRSRPDLLS